MTMKLIQGGKPTASQYRMTAKSGSSAEILMYGPIGGDYFGDGITADRFAKDLRGLGKVSAIDLRINSEGGLVFDGRTIYSLLADHPAKITVHVDGLAASIASLIAMAGDEIRMADGAFMMIHDAWGVAIGNGAEMRRTADLLDSVSGTLVDTYAARTRNSTAQIKQWMTDETWMPAKDALANGFCDSVCEPVRVAASLSRPERFKNLPRSLQPNRAAAAQALAVLSRK